MTGTAHDGRCCEALHGNDEAYQLEAVSKAAAFYRVARNLPKTYDTKQGLRRFAPLLDVIRAEQAASFEGQLLLPSINRVRAEISRRYGKRGVLSLTTKFLWFKFRDLIIIYDEQARKALRTKPGDIAAYYSTWRTAFEECKHSVAFACASLPRCVTTAQTRGSVSPHTSRCDCHELSPEHQGAPRDRINVATLPTNDSIWLQRRSGLTLAGTLHFASS
jgi:hypothetical protein